MMHAALEPVYVYQAFASKWDALGDGARCQTAEQWDWFVRRVNDSDPARWPDAAAVFGASHSVEPFGSKLEFLMASLGATTPDLFKRSLRRLHESDTASGRTRPPVTTTTSNPVIRRFWTTSATSDAEHPERLSPMKWHPDQVAQMRAVNSTVRFAISSGGVVRNGSDPKTFDPDPERLPHITWEVKDLATGKFYASGVGADDREAFAAAMENAVSADKPLTRTQLADPNFVPQAQRIADLEAETASLREQLARAGQVGCACSGGWTR
jgi:hypothetical protein